MPKGRPLPPHKDTAEPSGTGRDEKGRILPGVALNPTGKPPGSRNKIIEVFLRDLQADWLEHGVKAIQRLRKADVRGYVSIVAGLVPKELKVDENRRIYRIRDVPLTAEEWALKHTGQALPQPPKEEERGTLQ